MAFWSDSISQSIIFLWTYRNNLIFSSRKIDLNQSGGLLPSMKYLKTIEGRIKQIDICDYKLVVFSIVITSVSIKQSKFTLVFFVISCQYFYYRCYIIHVEEIRNLQNIKFTWNEFLPRKYSLIPDFALQRSNKFKS